MNENKIYKSSILKEVFNTPLNNNTDEKKFIISNNYSSKFYSLDLITNRGYCHITLSHKKLLQLLNRKEIKRNYTSLKSALFTLFNKCICIKCVY